MKFKLILVITLFCLSRCSAQLKEGLFSVKQGITGRVLWKEGNQMPSPDRPAGSNGIPVERELAVYKLTRLNETETNGPFFTHIKTELVAKVKSTKTGYFEIALPPGKYSLFSVEPKGLFASITDGNQHIYPVEVKEGSVSPVVFVINYKASY